MPTALYPSQPNAEVIVVEFVALAGETRLVRLLVDSGFTGKSSFVLSASHTDLIWAPVPAANATGALQGPQQRAWVACRVAGLAFEWSLIAILTDVSLLSLPPGASPSAVSCLGS